MAIDKYHEAINCNNDFNVAKFNLANSFYSKKQYNKSIDLLEEMLVSEKFSSENTRRAYKKDIEAYIKFINKTFKISILNVSTNHIRNWLIFLRNDKKISRNSHSRKVSSIKVFYKFFSLYFFNTFFK